VEPVPANPVPVEPVTVEPVPAEPVGPAAPVGRAEPPVEPRVRGGFGGFSGVTTTRCIEMATEGITPSAEARTVSERP
jgi:hypothetical protein